MFFSGLFKKKAVKKVGAKTAPGPKAKKAVKVLRASASKTSKMPHSPRGGASDVLRPDNYFDTTRCNTITRAINALPGITVASLVPQHPLAAAGFKGFSASGCTVKFRRNEFVEYSATLGVAPEENGTMYRMHGEICNAKGKMIFSRTRTELDFLQVENALVFVFISAFAEF